MGKQEVSWGMVGIMCLACQEPQEFKNDKEYKEHLLKVHGATTSQGAMDVERAKKMNAPVNLPGGISEKDLPNKEFLETVKRIEEQKKAEASLPPSPPQLQPTQIQPQSSTVVLKYKYEGRNDCGHELKTIMLETDDKLYAIGYDIVCDKMVKKIEVTPIKEEKDGNDSHKVKPTK